MERYEQGAGISYLVKDYGDGLLMIRDNGGHSGRCLFLTSDEEDRTLLVALLAYKKEGDEAPRSLVKTARERRAQYIESQRKG